MWQSGSTRTACRQSVSGSRHTPTCVQVSSANAASNGSIGSIAMGAALPSLTSPDPTSALTATAGRYV